MKREESRTVTKKSVVPCPFESQPLLPQPTDLFVRAKVDSRFVDDVEKPATEDPSILSLAAPELPAQKPAATTDPFKIPGPVSQPVPIPTKRKDLYEDAVESPVTPERVFEAYDTEMQKSTWNEIKSLGRGAFSKVVLGCPADRYLKPEYQGRALEFKVAIKIVDIALEGQHSRERMEGGLKREIDILKVSFWFTFGSKLTPLDPPPPIAYSHVCV